MGEVWTENTITDHGKLPMTSAAAWKPQVRTRVLTTPDPDDQSRPFLFCQLALRSVSEDLAFEEAHRAHQLAEAVMPIFEELARRHGARWGAIFVCGWKGILPIYWDGTRSIQVAFFETKRDFAVLKDKLDHMKRAGQKDRSSREDDSDEKGRSDGGDSSKNGASKSEGS
ncbi:Uu.00g125090.m01.CDS01 [Anthostomella pinea]|uniref:Uu.00g125090.m01.CDS01 n=1 Tax=Anthostomella pinea TaxID=933095 RepID=A0AAI8YHJ9_9PEZI|nr:Uu.00g125090.m01.CDS01 [Anthostomella pinea]